MKPASIRGTVQVGSCAVQILVTPGGPDGRGWSGEVIASVVVEQTDLGQLKWQVHERFRSPRLSEAFAAIAAWVHCELATREGLVLP